MTTPNGKSFPLSNIYIVVNGERREIGNVDIAKHTFDFGAKVDLGTFEFKVVDIETVFTGVVRYRRSRWYAPQAWRCERRAR